MRKCFYVKNDIKIDEAECLYIKKFNITRIWLKYFYSDNDFYTLLSNNNILEFNIFKDISLGKKILKEFLESVLKNSEKYNSESISSFTCGNIEFSNDEFCPLFIQQFEVNNISKSKDNKLFFIHLKQAIDKSLLIEILKKYGVWFMCDSGGDFMLYQELLKIKFK